MNPMDAWNIVNQATAMAALHRQDHANVIQALECLKKLIESQMPKESIPSHEALKLVKKG